MHKNIDILNSWALYKKEVKRFFKVYNQTIIAPIITSLIYLAMFSLAMGDNTQKINNIEFSKFIASGIIIMSSMQNAFANTSSSLIMSKISGSIIDYIIPPFSSKGLIRALSLSGATRGIIVGIFVYIAFKLFVDIKIYDIRYVIFYLVSASIILALLGILASIIAENFEQLSAINIYLITPLSFLSGTFYSIHNLPLWVNNINYYNPFFYIIDGFRYGLTGYHDSHLIRGISIMIICMIILYLVAELIFEKGWKIKN